jgi:cysteine desulfurase family protein (TIGR01976 family)
MSYNVERIRSDFPALDSGIAFFDGPGGTQTPRPVGQAISDAVTAPLSNRGTTTVSERNADLIVNEFRSAVADLTGADARGVVYGRSWTQLVYDFSRTLAKTWSAGDEIIVTTLDHDSNVRPWIQAAESRGAKVLWAGFDTETGELPSSTIADLLSSKTRFVSVTGASNVLGTKPDLKAIGQAVHASGALFAVDGVHLTPHSVIDVKEIGADLFGFSSYKMMGPHCGAMVADPEFLDSLLNDKLLPSTMNVPERFEFGTLPYEIMAGATAAINYTAGIDSDQSLSRRQRLVQSMNSLEDYETELFTVLEHGLTQISGVRTFGHAKHRTPTIFFAIDGVNPIAVYQRLAEKKINAPASNFYALEASRQLGLEDAGAVRAGLAPYSTLEDVERLISAVREIADSAQ